MTNGLELNVKQDLANGFPFVETVVNEHVILVIAYMAMAAISDVFYYQSGPFLNFAAELVYLAIASHYIRAVANSLPIAGQVREASFAKPGVPLFSLLFLQIVYHVVLFFGLFLFIVPGILWAVTSSVAIVVVVLEDVGAITALKRSHQLVKDRFWPVFTYLLKVSLAVLLPVALLLYGLDETMRFLTMRMMSEPLYIGAHVIINLLKGVVWFIGQLVFIACLTKLYQHLKSTEPPAPLPAQPTNQVESQLATPPVADMDLPPGALD